MQERTATRSSALLGSAPVSKLEIIGDGAVGGGSEADALRELSELQSANPDAFAQMMEAALGGGGAEGPSIEELWAAAQATPKEGERAPAQGARDGEIELPGARVLEADGSTRAAREASVRVVPAAGFVLKTKATLASELLDGIAEAAPKREMKYFINVCGSCAVGEPAVTKRLDASGVEVEGISVPVSIGPQRDTTDHSDQPCIAVDCIVNTQMLDDAAEDATGAKRDFLCQMAMTYVEQKYKLQIDRKYKLPRLRYKGGTPEENAQWIRDVSKRVVNISEVSSSEEESAQKSEAAPVRVPLGPAPSCELFYAASSDAALLPAPPEGAFGADDEWSFDNSQNASVREDAPLVLSPSDGGGAVFGFELPLGADRPFELVARLSVPKQTGDRDPWLEAKVQHSAFALSVRAPGRRALRRALPFAVLQASSAKSSHTAHRFVSADDQWVLELSLRCESADLAQGPDPGSQPWLVARALRGDDGDDDEEPARQEAEKSVADRYNLHKAPAAMRPSAALLAPPPRGASTKELAYAASHAAAVAARAAQHDQDADDEEYPEERFHKADIVSQHYIGQREGISTEKKDRHAQEKKDREDGKDADDTVEYLDLDDFRVGGKKSPEGRAAEAAGITLPPPAAANDDAVPIKAQPVVRHTPPPALLSAAAACAGPQFKSSLWAELL